MKQLLETSWGRLVANVAVAIGYAGLASLSMLPTLGTGLASPVWPASGVAFALVAQYGWRIAPGVALGSFLNNAAYMAGDGVPVASMAAVAAAIGIGAALQAAFGSLLVQRNVGRHLSLVGLRQIALFLALAGPVACVVNPSVGLLAQRWANLVPETSATHVWITWWVGDALGVVLFAPLAMMLLPEQEQVWRRRRLSVALPALVAAGLALLIFLQGARMADEQKQLQASALADSASASLSGEIRRNESTLEGMRGLFLAADVVSAPDFRVYANNALREEPVLQALSWNPWLAPSQLAKFEQKQREIDGFADYAVTEKAADGNLQPVQPRDHYVPVGFIEPLANNLRALGYDIGSDPVRAAAIATARNGDGPAATAPVRLVQETGSQSGFLMMLPVRKEGRLAGFVVGVYRAEDLIRGTFTGQVWNSLQLTVTDVTDPRMPVPLAERRSVLDGAGLPTLERDITVGGRTWRLAVTLVQAASDPPQLVNSSPVMVVGLLIALLLMVFLLLVTGTEQQARMEAQIDPLTGLKNRRALLAALESARRASQLSTSQHALLFLDLDHFKPINDLGGHDFGDQVLARVGQMFRAGVRERDVVARVGGDEFAILLRDVDASHATEVADSLIAAVHSHRVDVRGQDMTLGLSIGITMITGPDPEEATDLLRQADAAAYAAKRSGGNAVRTHLAVG